MLGRRHDLIPDGSLQILELLTGGSIPVTISYSKEASPPFEGGYRPHVSESVTLCVLKKTLKKLLHLCHTHPTPRPTRLMHLLYGNNRINLAKISRTPTVILLWDKPKENPAPALRETRCTFILPDVMKTNKNDYVALFHPLQDVTQFMVFLLRENLITKKTQSLVFSFLLINNLLLILSRHASFPPALLTFYLIFRIRYLPLPLFPKFY